MTQYLSAQPGSVDGYIDDGMAACLDLGENVSKLQLAVALAVHTIFRSLGGEIQPRKDPLSKKKLQEEGAPNEQKTALGWDVNTRHFRVHLPVYKNIVWSEDITRVITTKTTTYDEVKKILGRLT